MLALVALRLGLGCHFLYEGVWKIEHRKQLSAWGGPAIREAGGWNVEHREEFSAEPFLTQAKGPLAGFFYAMVPDIDGRKRLRVEKDPAGKPKAVDGSAIADRWNHIWQEFADYYRPGTADADAAFAYTGLKEKAEGKYNEFREQLDEYLKDNLDGIAAHFDALDRFENDPERDQTPRSRSSGLGPDDGVAARGGQVDQGRRRAGAGVCELAVGPAGRAAETAGPADGHLERLPLGADGADQLRGHFRADGDWVVPDVGFLHAVGGVGRGGVHVLRGDDAAGLSRHLPARQPIVGHALLFPHQHLGTADLDDLDRRAAADHLAVGEHRTKSSPNRACRRS